MLYFSIKWHFPDTQDRFFVQFGKEIMISDTFTQKSIFRQPSAKILLAIVRLYMYAIWTLGWCEMLILSFIECIGNYYILAANLEFIEWIMDVLYKNYWERLFIDGILRFTHPCLMWSACSQYSEKLKFDTKMWETCFQKKICQISAFIPYCGCGLKSFSAGEKHRMKNVYIEGELKPSKLCSSEHDAWD